MIYLDYAAATPMDSKVLTAMRPYFSADFFNPSAVYGPARDVRAAYEDARHRIAQTIGAKPAEIVLTAGATESINLAFASFADARNTITTAIEHPAVLECARAMGATILPVDGQGRLNLDELYLAITDDTQLVSVGYANNEIGTVQDIKGISAMIAEVRADRQSRDIATPLLFHTDASQAAGCLDVNVARLGVDLMTLNAGKCYGPKQVGLLYARAGVRLSPLLRGGGQEMGLRSGTENVAGAVGFARALQIAEKKRKTEAKRLGGLRDDLEKYIAAQFSECGAKLCKCGKCVVINGGKKHRLPNIVNFSLPGLDGERLVYALDQRGICVATGSACAANKGSHSHVLAALGLPKKVIDGSLRISLGRQTTPAQIEQFKKHLTEVVERERRVNA